MSKFVKWPLLFLATLSAHAQDFPAPSSLYVRYSADSDKNLTLPALEKNFTAAEVEVGSSRLKIADLGFGPLTYPKGLGYATPVYFSTTGALPAALEPGKPYYIVPASGGGYRVFPAAADADASHQPGGVPGEKVLPAQNVVQGVAAVVFRDGGSGAHRIFTKPALSQFTDLTGHGFHSSSRHPTNRHMMLEIDRDAADKPFVRTAGALVRENWVGSYSAYGPTFFQGPSEKRYEARQQVGGKRVVYQIYVARVRSYQERQVLKFMAAPGNIQDSRIFHATDARVANRFEDGDLINVKTYGDGKLPAPLQEGRDYFAQKIDGKNIALHASREEAKSHANPITLTDPGSGSFLFWAPERVADSRRWSFFTEVLAPDSGGNTLSARLVEPVKNGLLKNSAAFATSGPDNGELRGPVLPDLTPIVFWTPPRATLPPPLEPGEKYWISKGKGSALRLHASLEGAREAIGKPTPDSNCLKFTAPGHGESLVNYDDNASALAYGTLGKGIEPFQTRVPLGPLSILVFKIDFDDPAKSSAYATLGLNEVETEGKLLAVEKALTPAAIKESYPAWTMFNSAQGHVPIDLDLYEVVFGSSAEAVPDSDLQAMIDYFKKKYGIR